MVGVNPVVAAGGGRVYSVCMGMSDGTLTPFQVAGVLELSASADGGKTWSPWRTMFVSTQVPFPTSPGCWRTATTCTSASLIVADSAGQKGT